MVTPVAVATVWLTALSSVTSHHIAESLAESLIQQASSRTISEVTSFLAEAVRVSDLYALRVDTGRLNVGQLDAWRPFIIEDLRTTPQIASICLGTSRGTATWALDRRGRIDVGSVSADKGNLAVELAVEDDNRVGTQPLRTYQYDPRLRPWYTTAMESDGPTWTPIYLWFDEHPSANELTTGTGYVRSFATGGKPGAVLVVDVSLQRLTKYLERLPLSAKGRITIIDDQNRMVASSSGDVLGPKRRAPDGR